MAKNKDKFDFTGIKEGLAASWGPPLGPLPLSLGYWGW